MPNNNRYAFRNRLDFSKIPTTIQIPNLIEVQKRSYDRFLQMDMLPSERDDGGLQAVFQSVFPISDFRNVSQLEFVELWLDRHHRPISHRRCALSEVRNVQRQYT